MIKLSIIIPVYNVVQYLAKCLESLIDQDVPAESYEILIINDGSTDDSLSIADDFSEKHRNVRVISQENGGLSAARNRGIEEAQGKFLMFVDSDDYLVPASLGDLVRRMTTDTLDVLRFNYQSVDEAGLVIPKTAAGTFAVDMDETVVDGKVFLTRRLGWACYAPMYIIKTKIFAEGDLFFKPGILYEDAEWLPRLLLRAERVSSVDQVVYNYLRRTGSITKPTDDANKVKAVRDRLALISSLQDLNSKHPGKEVSLWIRSFVALSVIKILSSISQSPDQRKSSIIATLRQMNVLPLSSWNFTVKQKIQVFLINISPQLYMRYKGRG